jgi:hypothetical protein
MKMSDFYDKQEPKHNWRLEPESGEGGVKRQQKYRLIFAGLLKQWATGWTAEVQFPAGVTNFSVLHSVQNGSEAQPVSHPMGTGGCFPGNKTGDVKNGGAIPSLFHTPLWRNA